MLIGAAKRLKTGKAVGVDIWQASDQYANSDAAAVGNARLVGVADRVEVRTADMRSLPFADNTFDIVVTSWAVHNLSAQKDREHAIDEMARVLRPGGQLLLVDIENRAEYMQYVQSIGLEKLTVIVSKLRDQILRVVTFGSFRPATNFANKPGTL